MFGGGITVSENNTESKIISLVGMCGSGKTNSSSFLQKKGFSYLRFGDITMEELKKRNLEVNEKNERLVREGLRKEHGMEAYAKLSIPKLRQLLEKGNVIADGLYSWEEYKLLKKEFGRRIVVLLIQTSPSTRAKRLAVREIRPLTREEVASRDSSEIENLNKGGPISMADYTIVNEGSLGELSASMDSFLSWMESEEGWRQ